MAATPDDDQLMRFAQEGDHAAFGILFDRHHKVIYNYLRKLGMQSALAEEATQDAFLNVWRRRDSYRPGSSVRVYLYTVARNLWINEIRRAPLSGARFLSGRREEAADPLGSVEQRELAEQVRRAVAELPRDLREPFVLKRLQQLPYSEVAQITGLTERQAEDRVEKAFEALKERLNKEKEQEAS